LLGDSLDMLGDSLVYGFSLYVLKRSDRARIYAAILKGAIMVGFGLLVLAEAAGKLLGDGAQPGNDGDREFLGLAGNCFALVALSPSRNRHQHAVGLPGSATIRRQHLVRSPPAGGATGSRWPDIAVGAAIATLFL
jgi:Co/Zn/Cd efflux system component